MTGTPYTRHIEDFRYDTKHMGKHIPQEQKDEILSAIKNGLSVADASAQFSVSSKAIYRWLGKQTDNTGTSALEVSRLKRENHDLKEIIGSLTLEKRRGEKNRSRQNPHG